MRYTSAGLSSTTSTSLIGLPPTTAALSSGSRVFKSSTQAVTGLATEGHGPWNVRAEGRCGLVAPQCLGDGDRAEACCSLKRIRISGQTTETASRATSGARTKSFLSAIVNPQIPAVDLVDNGGDGLPSIATTAAGILASPTCSPGRQRYTY